MLGNHRSKLHQRSSASCDNLFDGCFLKLSARRRAVVVLGDDGRRVCGRSMMSFFMKVAVGFPFEPFAAHHRKWIGRDLNPQRPEGRDLQSRAANRICLRSEKLSANGGSRVTRTPCR